ncbi:MAG: hypothetical protein ACOYNQ_07820 [Burkholderiales bacterium]
MGYLHPGKILIEMAAHPNPKNLVIVGNALSPLDYSPLIDGAEKVLRFNECKQFGGRVGTKTDILCVTNTGLPARRYIEQRPFLSFDAVRSAVVWFPRDSGAHLAHLKQINQTHPRLDAEVLERELRDLSDDIIAANDLSGCAIERFSSDINDRVFKELARLGAPRLSIPSTGILALERIMKDPAFGDYRIHLLGFGFSGWNGHPWSAEKALVADYVRLDRLAYYPV